MKTFLFVLAGGLAFLAVPATGRAARVEADPNKEYVITPQAGPYVICVHAYIGPDARALANQLTLHLRQNGWQAYVFDYSAEERRKAQEWIDDYYRNLPPDTPRTRKIDVKEQWGVLIGGYADFDAASRDIAKVKRTPEPAADKTRVEADFIDPMTRRIYQLNPYAQCIATRNPTVPAKKADPNAPDPCWKELNDGRPYNLLKCGKPWTLTVKQFQGAAVIQPRSAASDFLDKIGLGSKSGDVLAASALQAEEVAKALHQLKYDAFVLHTRTGSIVTVGGYDSKDDKRLLQTAKELRNLSFGNNRDAIRLFEQPLPMKVPQL